MPLRDAARLLLQNQVSGAPVVDAQGKCVGVLSALDVLRLAGKREDATRPAGPPLPISCPFLVKRKGSDGKEITFCTVLPGVCPIQVRQKDADGKEIIVCSQPHCVLVDWQLVEVEKLPADEVRQFMTADPVTVPPDTSIRTLARLMIDAHIHRIIVVEEERKPVGIVSSTDILAAVAYAEDRE
jgi:CBS domain-containing protein